MKVPWLSLHPSLATWITFPLARLPVKIPFSHAVMVQCAELGDISGPLHTGGGECRHDYASLLETISRIDRASHSMADKVRCLCKRMEGCVWTAAPSHVRAAEVNDCMLRQTLCSTMRCSFWGGPVGGCCPQVEVAVAGNIMMKLQKQFSCQALGDE